MRNVRRRPRIELPDPRVIESLKRLSSEEIFALIGEANEVARELSAAGIRYANPDWSDDQIRAEVAQRFLGETS